MVDMKILRIINKLAMKATLMLVFLFSNAYSDTNSQLFIESQNIGITQSSDSDNVTWDVAIGDIDSDGDMDIVAGRLNVSELYLNDGGSKLFSDEDRGITIGRGSIGPSSTESIVLGDLNQNGILDLVAGGIGGTLMLNDESNNPYSGRRYVTKIGTRNPSVYDLALEDMDNDGDLDVVLGTGSINRLFMNNGTNAPFSHSTQGIPIAGEDTDFTDAIALGDLDGDGDIDLIARNINFGSVGYQNKMYLNNGTASPFDHLEEGTVIGDSEDGDFSNLVLGDVDNDGDLDLITSNFNHNKLYLNDGSTSPFSSPGNGINLDSNGVYLAIGDVDSDGDLDLLSSGFSSGEDKGTFLNLNNGGSPPIFSDGIKINDHDGDIYLGDMDADGDLDIIVSGGYEMKLFLNEMEQKNPSTNNSGGGAYSNFTLLLISLIALLTFRRKLPLYKCI